MILLACKHHAWCFQFAKYIHLTVLKRMKDEYILQIENTKHLTVLKRMKPTKTSRATFYVWFYRLLAIVYKIWRLLLRASIYLCISNTYIFYQTAVKKSIHFTSNFVLLKNKTQHTYLYLSSKTKYKGKFSQHLLLLPKIFRESLQVTKGAKMSSKSLKQK